MNPIQSFIASVIAIFVKAAALLRPVYLFLPGLISLLLYYLIIVKFSMGQDMLMMTIEKSMTFICFNFSLLLWALFAWFSSRLVSDIYTATANSGNQKVYKHLPRLLGINVLVALQLAALNLPIVQFPGKSKDFFSWILIALFVWHILYYFLLNKTFRDKERKFAFLAMVLGLSYIGFLIYAFFSREVWFNHLYVWFALSIAYFLIEVLFVWAMNLRRERLNTSSIQPQTIVQWRKNYTRLFYFAIFIYLCIIFSTTCAKLFGPLGCVLLAFGIWVAFLCKVKSYGIQKNVRFGLLILIWAVLIGFLFDPYKVQLIEPGYKNCYDERPRADDYLESWLADAARKDKIAAATKEEPYIVYTVIADGGASKAGYWAAGVLVNLEQLNPNDPFSNHILSLAGASGGSVGNAAYYSLLHERFKGKKTLGYRDEVSKFFGGDFLTYTVARYLGPDLIRHLFPYRKIDDRAAALETAMECMSNSKVIGNDFKKPLDEIFDYQGHLPIIFINSTNLEEGIPGIVSNIKIDTTITSRNDVLGLINQQYPSKNKHMKLSTAAVIGARFPYLSPAGEINGRYFVDGGYFDNSGGGITLELLQRIMKRINNPSDKLYRMKEKLWFKVLYLSNGSVTETSKNRLHPLVNDLAAPLLTVLGTYGEQTNMSNKHLRDYIESIRKMSFIQLNLPLPQCQEADDRKSTDSEKDQDNAPYPLNWVISKYNLDRIEFNIGSVQFPLEKYQCSEYKVKQKNHLKR